jgi:formate/nitrite transporter
VLAALPAAGEVCLMLPETLIDAYSPQQIALRVEQAGVAKARLPPLQTVTLGILAGAFIAFGAMYSTVVLTDHGLGFGPSRLLAGLAFSLGLVLVILAGAELFTGNTLIVMAWVDGRVSLPELARNWCLVYAANFVGAVGAAALVVLADGLYLADGRVGETAAGIARAKVALGWGTGFFRGILCNALVCLAVWLSFAARDVAGKILAITFPISAFVALGFEHSIANMYLIVVALLSGAEGVTMGGLVRNLIPVTAGNIVGGGLFVAGVYWLCYRYRLPEQAPGPQPARPPP